MQNRKTVVITSGISALIGFTLFICMVAQEWPVEEEWRNAYWITVSIIGCFAQFVLAVGMTTCLLILELLKPKRQQIESPVCIGMLIAFNIGWVITLCGIIIAYYYKNGSSVF